MSGIERYPRVHLSFFRRVLSCHVLFPNNLIGWNTNDLGIEVAERSIAMDEVVAAYNNKKLSEAFAVGTAATVAPIASIRHRDVNILIPVQNKSSIAGRVLARMEAIRTGEEPDEHAWLFRI